MAEGLSETPRSEGENQRVGGLECEADEVHAHLWGMAVLLSALLLAYGISGAHILGVHLSVSTNSQKACDLQITASEACSMVVEPLCSQTPGCAMNPTGIKTQRAELCDLAVIP